ncbi:MULTISPECIES: hypothetical protein [unclassified Wolbachia]|uniref:hypothetical protein n=1 Tax=unclassified Wolbachia TaxID=2640676 RepID=UPI0022328006|nr:hypothetical protein [Wolbachia endosymbiont (group A) of Apoderus coryli]
MASFTLNTKVSSQCLTLGSSPFTQFHQKRCKGSTAFVFTNLVPNLDPSVKHITVRTL